MAEALEMYATSFMALCQGVCGSKNPQSPWHCGRGTVMIPTQWEGGWALGNCHTGGGVSGCWVPKYRTSFGSPIHYLMFLFNVSHLFFQNNQPPQFWNFFSSTKLPRTAQNILQNILQISFTQSFFIQSGEWMNANYPPSFCPAWPQRWPGGHRERPDSGHRLQGPPGGLPHNLLHPRMGASWPVGVIGSPLFPEVN